MFFPEGFYPFGVCVIMLLGLSCKYDFFEYSRGIFRMIELTKLDETKILLNEDYILLVEETPDTVITFSDGKKIIVKESRTDIKDLVKRS